MENVFQGKGEGLKIEGRGTFHQTDLLPNSIKERHLDSQIKTIKFGVDSALPSGSTHTKAYFATDTNKLYLWNGTAWVSTTLT